MTYTWGDIQTAVELEIDMQGEDFCTTEEMMGYGQRAINKLEALLATLSEDYLLFYEQITLTSGLATYSLPTGIYAHKVRRIFFDDGGERYKVHRIKNLDETMEFESGDRMKYLLTNSTDPSVGVKLVFYPTPELSGPYITLWYLRNTTELVDDTTVVEIPEGFDYIKQYVKDAVINKERQQPDAPPSAALLDLEKIFIDTLTDRQPDEDNQLVAPDDLLCGNVALMNGVD